MPTPQFDLESFLRENKLQQERRLREAGAAIVTLLITNLGMAFVLAVSLFSIDSSRGPRALQAFSAFIASVGGALLATEGLSGLLGLLSVLVTSAIYTATRLPAASYEVSSFMEGRLPLISGGAALLVLELSVCGVIADPTLAPHVFMIALLSFACVVTAIVLRAVYESTSTYRLGLAGEKLQPLRAAFLKARLHNLQRPGRQSSHPRSDIAFCWLAVLAASILIAMIVELAFAACGLRPPRIALAASPLAAFTSVATTISVLTIRRTHLYSVMSLIERWAIYTLLTLLILVMLALAWTFAPDVGVWTTLVVAVNIFWSAGSSRWAGQFALGDRVLRVARSRLVLRYRVQRDEVRKLVEAGGARPY